MLKTERMVWPPAVARTPIPEKVPESIAKDHAAACRVLADSPEASAALSRRCLQNLLVEKVRVKKKDLADQIEEVLASKQLPARRADDLHAIRVIGNFAAHPIKSKITGEIVEVEFGEAEWNLDVLEGLFQHYCVDEEPEGRGQAAPPVTREACWFRLGSDSPDATAMHEPVCSSRLLGERPGYVEMREIRDSPVG